MTLEQKAEKYAYDFHIRQHETGRSKSVHEVYIDGFNDGYDAGFKDCAKKEWHNINDTKPSKEQLGKQLLIRMKSITGNTEYDYLVYKYTGESIADVPDIIAWKEIEK